MMFRVGLHHLQGEIDVTNGGRVKLSDTVVHVGMTHLHSGDLMMDGSDQDTDKKSSHRR